MPIYNSPDLLLDGVNSRWLLMLSDKGPSPLEGLIEETETDSQFERYPVLGSGGGLAQWVDEIAYGNINDYVQLVENIPYQQGYLVDRYTLGDTKKTLGSGLESFINQQLQNWKTQSAKVISAQLLANPTAFDGTAFFSATRPNLASTGAANNIVTGTGITIAQLTADLSSGMGQMRSLRQSNGDPYNPMIDFVVMCPPALEESFLSILQADLLSIGGVSTTNTFKGRFRVVVNPFLSAAAGSVNDWYLINAASPYKFAVSQTDVNNPPMWDMVDEKDKREIKYFTTGRMGFGLINPLAIQLVNNA